MPRLLVVHHTPSPPMDSLLEAVLDGARNPQIDGVEVLVRAALSASVRDVLESDGFILGTPANLGYMSGALKDFFDRIYYPCLRETQGRPYGVYVHGNNDVDGALTGIERIVKGLGWTKASAPVTSIGPVTRETTDECWELGAVTAALIA